MGIIFDPMNMHKYRSYLQYQVIKKYAFTCTDQIDDLMYGFHSNSITSRFSELKSLHILNKYMGQHLNQMYLSVNFNNNDVDMIKMIVNEISEQNGNKDLMVIPGILNHSETLTHTENLRHLLTDTDRGETTESLYCIDKLLQNIVPLDQCFINVLHIKNKHIFSAPLFQPPYYYPGSDLHNNTSLSINLGGIGTFIAFQIISVRKTEILDHQMDKIKLLLEKNQIHIPESEQKDINFVQMVQDVVSMIRGLNLCLSALIHLLEQNDETLVSDRLASDRLASDRLASDRLASDRLASDRLASDRLTSDRLASDRLESYKELFFESYACAHINNTRTYMVNGKIIKLTGRFWVNIINDLNIFTS